MKQSPLTLTTSFHAHMVLLLRTSRCCSGTISCWVAILGIFEKQIPGLSSSGVVSQNQLLLNICNIGRGLYVKQQCWSFKKTRIRFAKTNKWTYEIRSPPDKPSVLIIATCVCGSNAPPVFNETDLKQRLHLKECEHPAGGRTYLKAVHAARGTVGLSQIIILKETESII